MRCLALALALHSAAQAAIITTPPNWDLVLDARPGQRGSIDKYDLGETGPILLTQVFGDVDTIERGSWQATMSTVLLWTDIGETLVGEPWQAVQEQYGGPVAAVRWAPVEPLTFGRYGSGIYRLDVEFMADGQPVQVSGEVNTSLPEPGTLLLLALALGGLLLRKVLAP